MPQCGLRIFGLQCRVRSLSLPKSLSPLQAYGRVQQEDARIRALHALFQPRPALQGNACSSKTTSHFAFLEQQFYDSSAGRWGAELAFLELTSPEQEHGKLKPPRAPRMHNGNTMFRPAGPPSFNTDWVCTCVCSCTVLATSCCSLYPPGTALTHEASRTRTAQVNSLLLPEASSSLPGSFVPEFQPE